MDSKRPLIVFASIILLMLFTSCELSLAQDITPPPNYQRVSLERPPAEAIFILPENSPILSSGAAIFAESCAPCHGEYGLGGGAQTANLPAEPPSIGSAELASQASPVDWFAIVTLGNIANLMPPFEAALSVQERWDVLAYVYSLSDSEEVIAAVLPDGMQIVELPQPEATEPAAAAGTAQPPAAQEDDRPNGDGDTQELGTISGTISHGAGTPLPPDLEVTLLGLDSLELVSSDTVVLEVDGSFTFEDVELSPDRIFFASLDYQGMSYSSRFDVMPEDGNTLDFPITIFDTIVENSGLVISTLVIQLEFPDADTTRIHYIYQIKNPTLQTVIPPGEGLPTLSYALPQNALNFSFDIQIEGDYFVITPDGFGDTRVIMAGSDEYVIAFSYDLSYSRELSIDLDEHIAFIVESMKPISARIDLAPTASAG
ncbi:MAG: cytochrome c [Chloroflexi bacterium]|nr:cytochrome c [Chloroflexota bacterium]